MRVLFYSNRCEYSRKALIYLENHNITNMFQLINVDTDKDKVPSALQSVPTIIDSKLTEELKGENLFKYLVNIKYFNNPTNNIEYIKDIIKPDIKEDELAMKTKITCLQNNNDNNDIDINQPIVEQTNDISNQITKPNYINYKEYEDLYLKPVRVLNDTTMKTKIFDLENNIDVNKTTQNMINSRRAQDRKIGVLMRLSQ